jgi:hypothetical protein
MALMYLEFTWSRPFPKRLDPMPAVGEAFIYQYGEAPATSTNPSLVTTRAV